ncbi:MAG: ATP-binding protein, partial [Pseudomonadota bacterium]|nr:ATP-binding protein [Pseudomonadota bacterium]
MDYLDQFLHRAERLLDRLEDLLPPKVLPMDWSAILAARWRKVSFGGRLEPVPLPHMLDLDDLQGIDDQRNRVDRNTCQFVEGLPANNVLLTGARGTGKSSLVKAMLTRYGHKGLRLVEVDKADLVDLPDLVSIFVKQDYRFIVFCDDLSFEDNDASYKSLKVALDGSLGGYARNVLIYATSNRRHLLPEHMSENLETQHVNGEIHPGETTEEKISLSERFGLWVPFYPFTQSEYLAITAYWLNHFGLNLFGPEIQGEALRF